jgi:CIC family chloride channel protein
VPVVGSLGVTFIVTTFAPEAKGHGIPEVMDAIYYGCGIIRPVVAAAKSVASALAIGSGVAMGREGPIIQIGSALGSTLAQWVAMPAAQCISLVAAGAGIAALPNTAGSAVHAGAVHGARRHRGDAGHSAPRLSGSRGRRSA